MCMTISSPAFFNGATIPERYTGDGEDVSPPLRWRGTPADTKEFALLCEDPDAPTQQAWVHWLVYKIPASIFELPEALPKEARLKKPIAIYQGCNSWSNAPKVGYRGPAPPSQDGTHHYCFRLYALANSLDLEPGIDRATFTAATRGQILAQTELVGTYQR